MGMLPESVQESKLYGVEIDSVSGSIAKQLYQKNKITIQGYEDSNFPDSFFDAAVGNVPFGDFKAADERYDKNNFLIHGYFFAKTLDNVRPGGIVAFINSSSTMDKKNNSVRKYLAQRAELIGAVRLPNNTFKSNAGTEVTSDILIIQTRDRLIEVEPEWVHLGTDENGIALNQYYIDHPEMILGIMEMVSGPFGPVSTCKPLIDADHAEQLNEAIHHIHGEIAEYEKNDITEDETESITADPDVRNFSYTLHDSKIY